MLCRIADGLEQLDDRGARTPVERRECLAPRLGKGEVRAALVRPGRRGDETPASQGLEGPAEIPAIQRERVGNLAGRGMLAMGELVEDAHLGQREGAAEVGVAK